VRQSCASESGVSYTLADFGGLVLPHARAPLERRFYVVKTVGISFRRR
jgi:hypothetical protein